MKKKISALEAAEGTNGIGDNVVQRLISDFETLAVEYEALGQLFDSAAARLTVVHRGLV
jgi:hypothetical protein